MASSPSPPLLPITTVQSADPTAQTLPPRAAAVRDFLTRLADTTRHSLANRRPWPELLDRSSLSRPDSISTAISRLRANVAHFRVNYSVAIAAIVVLSLLSNPFSLLLLVILLAAWAFLYLLRPSDSPLVILGRSFSDREALAGLVLFSVFVVFLTSIASIIMTAVAVGAAVVAVHGVLRVPEDLFLDDRKNGGASVGFLAGV